MKRKSSPASSTDDFKPSLSEAEDVKPTTSKKAKAQKAAQKGSYAPGSKQALAELIVELGVKALPPNKEVAKMVTTQLDPRSGVRCNLTKYAKTL